MNVLDPVRYRSGDEDSGRWLGFPFRDGDIVISSRSKHGTTWMQMICALLVYRTPELPRPLADISPWLDWLGTPRSEVVADLQAQTHRRIIKTHTPLDGLPLDRRATFVVVARHPLDAAISLYHQGDNLDHERIRELIPDPRVPTGKDHPELVEWLRSWIDWDGPPAARLDSLPGVMWHLTDAWDRRTDENIVLAHYDDLVDGLEREMRRLAATLDCDDRDISELARAATFEAMRARSDLLAPGVDGVLRDRAAFFRRGSSGERNEVLSTEDLSRYEARARNLATDDLLAWLHR